MSVSSLRSEQAQLSLQLKSLDQSLYILRKQSAAQLESLWSRYQLVTFVKDGIANIELLLEQLQQYQASAYSADHADAACEISQTCEEIEKISQAVEKFEPDLNLTFASGSSASLDSGNFWIRLIERLNHTEGIYLPLRKILEEFIASVGKEEELLSGKVGDLQSEIVGLEEEFCSLIQEKFDYFSESNVLRFVEKENYANMAKSKQLEYEEIIEQYRRINPKLAQYIEMQVKSEAFQEVIDDIQNECGVFSPESDGTDLNADVIQNVELLERQTHQEQICTDRLYQQAFSMISKSDALENGLFQKVQSSFADAQFVQSEENSKLSLIQKNLRNILNKKELDKSMRQKFISSEFQIDSNLYVKPWKEFLGMEGINHDKISAYVLKLIEVSKRMEAEDTETTINDTSDCEEILINCMEELQKIKNSAEEISKWGKS